MAHVLVVDDEKSIRISLREFLKDAGHQVSVAEDADEAMGILGAQDVDVVLADIILPRITGVNLLQRVKETLPRVQVVLMTGEPTVETASEAVRADAFDYLAKPVAKERLLKTVANAATIKALDDSLQVMAVEARHHQENLERLVAERTATLAENHRRLSALMANLPGMAYRCDNDANWTMEFVSEGCLDLTGYPPVELVGNRVRSYAQIIHPDDRERVWDEVQAGLAASGFFELEYRLVTAAGKAKWVRENGTGVYGEGGERLALEGVILDNDARKRAEVALRNQQQTLESIFRAAPIGIGLVVDRVFREVNNSFCAMTGYSREELLDHSARMVYPSDEEFERVGREKYAQISKTGSGSVETCFRRKNGEVIDILVGSTLLDLANPAAGATFTALDITERKRSDQALREGEQGLRTIFEQAAVGVALIESKTGRFLRINQRYCDIVGYSVAEMSGGKTFQEITHPDDLKPDLDNMARLLAGEIREFTMEKRYYHRNGSIVWVNLTVSPTWGPQEEPTNHIAVVEDITERKRAEEALRNSRERLRHLAASLESAREEERAAIAQEVHDELGQALTGLTMDLAWLKGHLFEARGEAFTERLQASEALAHSTLDGMRRLAARLRPPLLDDLGLVAAVEWQAKELTDRIGCALDLDLTDEDIGLSRERDITVFRILQEALTNVARHAQASRVRVSLRAVHDVLQMEVVDDGKGIRDLDMDSVTSMGLTGMRERAGALGGQLNIGPLAGGGTQVVLRLPIGGESP